MTAHARSNSTEPSVQRATPRGFALVLALSALLTVYMACQGVDDPQLVLEELSLRDILGLAPDHLEGLSDAERTEVRARLGSEGASQEGWLADWTLSDAPFEGRALAAPYDRVPADPLNALVELDGTRQSAHAEAWVFGLFVHTERGVETFGCAFEPTETPVAAPRQSAGLGRGHYPTSWSDVVGFDTELDPEVGPQEVDWLADLSFDLEAWRLGCLDAAGLPEQPDPLRVVRQVGAPFALSYWPQRRSLFVNPNLLFLWHANKETPAAPRFGTLQQAQVSACRTAGQTGFDMDACTTELACVCDKCTVDYIRQNPSDPDCNSPLFPNRAVPADCQEIRAIDSGFLRYCVFEAMQSTASASVCMRSAGFGEACGTVGLDGQSFESRLDSAARLKRAYLGFASATSKDLCLGVLLGCLGEPVALFVEQEPEPDAAKGRPDNCEHDCWDFCLNDTACNDTMGSMCGVDLFWWDPNRRGLNEVMCEEDQPTHVCSEENHK